MPLSGDKFTRPLGPNSSIANQIQTGTTILAANIRSQTRMFPKRRAKTNPLQHRETSSSLRTFQVRNTAYERITNLQHRETSQTPEDSFFDEISFLDKNNFLEDQTVIRTNIFSKYILHEDSKRNQRKSWSLRSDRALTEARSLCTYMARFGRYEAAELSLKRSDRARTRFGRYEAAKLSLKLGRYVATEHIHGLIAT
ncbi:hypothetical protein F2Q69_00059269 [Brassica cretica]|uniref:Uncharacterized protein n=1 Tax=Brassica cretica TaxID=69181 RepID=A0A8S9RFS5_BRACR|nr:hypothetical protein F2Q69_00059269 [Brassica cretica]